jgi:hypothetical protein
MSHEAFILQFRLSSSALCLGTGNLNFGFYRSEAAIQKGSKWEKLCPGLAGRHPLNHQFGGY